MRNMVQLTVLLAIGFFVLAPGSAEADSSWLDPGWLRRIPFSVADGALEPGSGLSDFTMVLTLESPGFADVFAYADSLGEELVITLGDGVTQLDHEIVDFDLQAQRAEIWFRAPTLSEAARDYFIYYDLSQPSTEAASRLLAVPGAAWTAAHLAVYHFSEDPSLGVLKDWGPASHDAVAATRFNPTGPGWTSSNLTEGAVGTGWRFDGVDVWAYADLISSPDSSFTISAWFANSQLVDKGAMAFQSLDDPWNISFQRTQGDPNADIETPNGVMSWLPDVIDEEPHLFTWVLDGAADTARFYLDGVEQDWWLRYTPPSEPAPVWDSSSVGGRVGIIGPAAYNTLDIADGVADEFRLVEGIRSSDWIQTEFRNQSSPATFFAAGAVQQYDGGPTGVADPFALSPLGPISVSPNPFSGVARIAVETTLSDLSVQVFDLKGRLVRTLSGPTEKGDRRLRFIWDGRDASGTHVGNGVYLIRARSGSQMVTGKTMLVR